MLQASLSDCQFFDFLPFPEYGFVPSEVDVGRCDVVDALVMPLLVLVVDKGFDLGLRMIRRTARVLHAFVLQPFGQIPRDVTGSAVAE